LLLFLIVKQLRIGGAPKRARHFFAEAAYFRITGGKEGDETAIMLVTIVATIAARPMTGLSIMIVPHVRRSV
jgi:hypothetical protein